MRLRCGVFTERSPAHQRWSLAVCAGQSVYGQCSAHASSATTKKTPATRRSMDPLCSRQARAPQIKMVATCAHVLVVASHRRHLVCLSSAYKFHHFSLSWRAFFPSFFQRNLGKNRFVWTTFFPFIFPERWGRGKSWTKVLWWDHQCLKVLLRKEGVL